MGDMGLTKRNWMADKDFLVCKKEIQCQIQERRSRIARLNQEIEDMKLGVIVAKEADILMLEKELSIFTVKLESLTPANFDAPEKVIEVTGN